MLRPMPRTLAPSPGPLVQPALSPTEDRDLLVAPSAWTRTC